MTLLCCCAPQWNGSSSTPQFSDAQLGAEVGGIYSRCTEHSANGFVFSRSTATRPLSYSPPHEDEDDWLAYWLTDDDDLSEWNWPLGEALLSRGSLLVVTHFLQQSKEMHVRLAGDSWVQLQMLDCPAGGLMTLVKGAAALGDILFMYLLFFLFNSFSFFCKSHY